MLAKSFQKNIILLIYLFIFTCFFIQNAYSLENNIGSKNATTIPPSYGDMLVIGALGEPGNLIPQFSTDSFSNEISEYFYIAPLKYDKNLIVEKWAAEKFEIVENGLLLKFTLKKGIFWEDGVELTAEDVEFTYNCMIDPKTPTAYRDEYLAIKSFTVLDKYSFEVRYEKPYVRSINTWMQPILPKHALEGQDLQKTLLRRKPLSAGSYTLKKWESGSFLELEANKNFFEGKPYISKILYKIIPDITTMFLELKAGFIDIQPLLSPQQYSYQTNTPEFKKNYSIYRWLSPTYTYLGYNLKKALFSDVRVRKALAHAINKQEIIKGALLGQGVPTIGPYKPETWVYNSKIKDHEFNPELAKQLLAEAGWKPDKSGKLKKEGIPFSFTLLVNQGNEPRIITAILIQNQLKNIGIDVKIHIVEWAAFLNQFVNKGFFDAVILAWTLPVDPDNSAVWHSSGAGKGLNFIHYANAEVDKLLEDARSTLNIKERKRYYNRLQEILHEEQPYCFLYVPYTIAAVHKRVQGIKPVPAGVFYDSNKWFVPLEKQRYRLQQ